MLPLRFYSVIHYTYTISTTSNTNTHDNNHMTTRDYSR